MKVQAGPESTQGTIPAPPCIVDPTLIPRDPGSYFTRSERP